MSDNDLINDPTSISARSALARLIAAEDISVQHNPSLDTAAFDVEARVLYMPLWDGMSKSAYDMLTFHEVAHALHTPAGADALRAAIDEVAGGDKSMHAVAKDYLNVIEDPRIEKLIKRNYPGVRKDFAEGYGFLHNDKNLFAVKGADLSTYKLIDRINLHFKIGWMLPKLSFTDEEMVFVDRTAKAETFADVVAIAKDLFDHTKSEIEESMSDNPEVGDGTNDSTEDGESENGSPSPSDDSADGDSSNESGSGDEADAGDNGDGSAADSDSDSDSDGESEKPGSNGDDASAADSDDPTVSGSDGSSEAKGNKRTTNFERGEGKIATVEEAMKSETAAAAASVLAGAVNNDGSGLPTYANLPKLDLDKIVRPWRDVLNSHNTFFTSDMTSVYYNASKEKRIANEYNRFHKGASKSVSYLFTQFNKKKAARSFARTRTARSGKIDPTRLAYHKTSEDIFKSFSVTDKGKNHGILMFVDWSSSMSGCIKDTVEQLIQLAMFARKAGIKFDVYSFSDIPGNVDRYSAEGVANNDDPDALYVSNFGLHHYLSGDMSTKQFADACFNVWRIAKRLGGRSGWNAAVPSPDRMTGTPLHEAMLGAMALAPLFRAKHNLQILNVVFLTDGGSSSGLYRNASNDRYTYSGEMVLVDPKTKAQVKKEYNDYGAEALMKMLKEITGANTIRFHLPGSWHGLAYNTENDKAWANDGFIETKNSGGFDSFFVIRSSKFKEKEIKAKEAATVSELMSSKMQNKVLLGRIADIVAKQLD
jgi:hypothetical protein